MAVEVLAEPGSTHEGRTEWMLDLLDIAKAAGCDAVKHQFLSSATRLCERRRSPGYYNAYTLIEGSRQLWSWLVAETHARGLRCIATCYLPEDAQAIADARVDAIKIASFDALDPALLAAVGLTEKPVYISTGMMDQAQVDMLVGRYEPDVLFHCVSSYPAPVESLNLRVLKTWDRTFHHHRIGFSDHSANVITGAVAVAAGAEVLEVHYRHPQTPESNADYATAHTGDRLELYVLAARYAEQALGDGVKARQLAEASMSAYRVQP